MNDQFTKLHTDHIATKFQRRWIYLLHTLHTATVSFDHSTEGCQREHSADASNEWSSFVGEYLWEDFVADVCWEALATLGQNAKCAFCIAKRLSSPTGEMWDAVPLKLTEIDPGQVVSFASADHFCGWLEADSLLLQWGLKPVVEKKWHDMWMFREQNLGKTERTPCQTRTHWKDLGVSEFRFCFSQKHLIMQLSHMSVWQKHGVFLNGSSWSMLVHCIAEI